MGFQQFILAFLSGCSMIFGFYYLFAILYIHKKLFDRHFYFVIGCFACSAYILFELLLSLPFSDENYLLFQKLKILSAMIIVPTYFWTIYDCFFSEAKKYIVHILFILTPLFIFSLFFNISLSMPVKEIEINSILSRFTYHIGESRIVYSIWAIITLLTCILSLIYYVFSKLKSKKIPFFIIFLIVIPIASNDFLIALGLLKSYFLCEYFWFLVIAFLFIDFLYQDRKTYLSVIELSKELMQYQQELETKVENRTKELKLEKEKSDELLLNILPEEVACELKSNGKYEPKTFSMVTVMFADFKDFTKVSEKVSAELLVGEINHCFSAFDNILQKYNVEKIKTVGDAYMCAGGLPTLSYTHAVDVVNAGIDIRNYILERKIEKENKGEIAFDIRIGIHTGPVVAGIVGVKKFSYDIWGDTVNLAARMEQSCLPGNVNISGSTYELVKEKFNCSYRGKIEAKNKGEVDMYFVEPIQM